MTSHNPIVLDDEALERPPYTGIQQWTAMKQAARRGPAPSILTPYVPQTSSASKQDASTNHRQRTASAYYHLPVTPPQPSDLHQSTTKAPQAFAPWVVRTQQVCKGAATPTVVCGRYSTSLHDPAKQPKATRAGKGQYKYPRCQTGYSRIDSVRQHFPSCIALNGNPDCLSWTDDDSYAAGVVNRSASRAEDGVTAKARKTPAVKAAQLVTLSACEAVIRTATQFFRNSNGELPPSTDRKEEEDKAWKEIAKNLKEETRNAGEISPETEALIGMFREDGQWDSDSSDEA